MHDTLLPTSQGCERRPGGRHRAPCHPWHADRVDQWTVAAVHVIAGYQLPGQSAPGAPGRHCSPDVTAPIEAADYALAA